MYQVKIIAEFSSAHKLMNYNGKCENLHGHNWRVEVSVEAGTLDESGFVMDFIKLKEITNRFLKSLDHKVLNSLPFFKKQNPSAENIAGFIYEGLSKKMRHGAALKNVAVWETNSNCAVYSK